METVVHHVKLEDGSHGITVRHAQMRHLIQCGASDQHLRGLPAKLPRAYPVSEDRLHSKHLRLGKAAPMIPHFLLPLPASYLPDPPQVLIPNQPLLFAVAVLPDPRVFARWDRRLRLPMAYSLIATSFVIRAIAAYLLYLILYLLKQITQHLAVGEVVGRDHGSYYLARRLISPDVELSPSAALGVAVLTDFPFTFTEDFYARRVNDHMQRSIACAARQHYLKVLATAAQSSVIRRGLIQGEQLDYRLHQSFGSRQRQMKDLFQTSHAEDGCIR